MPHDAAATLLRPVLAGTGTGDEPRDGDDPGELLDGLPEPLVSLQVPVHAAVRRFYEF